jgi:hypothetical protein
MEPTTEAVVTMTVPAKNPQDVAMPALPDLPTLVELEGDLQNEVLWRRFMARQAASQTLSLQRTEWDARSVRLHLLWWFRLTVIGAVVGIVLLGILVASTGSETPPDPFFP